MPDEKDPIEDTELNNDPNLDPNAEDEGGKDEGHEEELPDDIEPEVRRKIEERQNLDEEEEEIDPEDQKRITKIVEKQVGSKLQEVENKMEVTAFVSAKPEFAKYQNQILKYMSHPAYANVPVHNIAAIVASKDLVKMGAAKERAAQAKVNTTKDPGNSARKPSGQGVDWRTASDEEFQAQRAKVLGRQGY